MSACSKSSAAANVYAELQRHYHREEEARNQAIVERARRLGIPLVATNGAAYATPAAARAARRLHLRPQPRHPGRRRPPAGAQLRAPRQNARRNGAPVRRSARSHRQHAAKSPRASNSPWPIWATNFRATPCPRAKRRCPSCASARTRARAAATSPITSAPAGRSSASWRSSKSSSCPAIS